jgi:hypothetical protein
VERKLLLTIVGKGIPSEQMLSTLRLVHNDCKVGFRIFLGPLGGLIKGVMDSAEVGASVPLKNGCIEWI